MSSITQTLDLLDAAVDAVCLSIQEEARKNRKVKAGPSVINVTIPDIVVNVPALKPVINVRAIPVLVKTAAQEAPTVNVQLPKQKIVTRTLERQVVSRNASGQMTGTQSQREYQYVEDNT